MSNKPTPYSAQPEHAFWRRAVSEVAPREVDPVVKFPITIDRSTRVATAGSCFAQHIARRLRAHGFNYYVTEPPHPFLSPDLAERYNYGTFSARYGNIYTSLQLRQLIERAYGRFHPSEDCWQGASERWWIDPFRPNIQPNGFNSRDELETDRRQHLAAVRTLFESLDVFIFTLGLTECWISKSCGAAFPLCPGVAGGVFDPRKYAFRNLSVGEVVSDMHAFIGSLRKVNAQSKVILTVSPVPLIATAGPDHVLSATTYSKSVLRAAAEELCRNEKNVCYFPSYEIIVGSFSRGRYFGSDCRDVTEEGVSHVMRTFFKHAAGEDIAAQGETTRADPGSNEGTKDFADRMQEIVDAICDEQLLDRPPKVAR
jgi:hypothetical protein